MKRVDCTYQMQNVSSKERMKLSERLPKWVRESPAYWNSGKVATIKIMSGWTGMRCYHGENFKCAPPYTTTTIDDFIRKFGEPHEIEAWFGEEKPGGIDPRVNYYVKPRSPEECELLMQIAKEEGYINKNVNRNTPVVNFWDFAKDIYHYDRDTEASIGTDEFLALAGRAAPKKHAQKQGQSSAGAKHSEDFYPDWKSLTPLPDKARPWAKVGERYVLLRELGRPRGGIICLGCNDESMYPYFNNGKGGHNCFCWKWLAKIPGETYAEDPSEAPEKEPEASDTKGGYPALEDLSLPLSVGQRFRFTENSPEIKGRFKIAKESPNNEWGGADYHDGIVASQIEAGDAGCCRIEIIEGDKSRDAPNYGTVFEVLPPEEEEVDKMGCRSGSSPNMICFDEAAVLEAGKWLGIDLASPKKEKPLSSMMRKRPLKFSEGL